LPVNVLFNGIGTEQAQALANVLKEHTTPRSLCGNSAHARLSDQFFDKNIFNVAGGIELAFMSTTTDKNVAMSYMRGKTGTIFEIQMGMIDKGADLSQLSQYPGESEILFTPLTGKQQRSTIYRF
jgi:hypothetical protein